MSAASAKSTPCVPWLFARGISVLRSGRFGTRSWQAGVLALALTAATLALRLALDRALNGEPTLMIFAVPIMLSAYFGGMRAGLLATAFSVLGAGYFLLPPIYRFAVAAPSERWQLFFVALAGVTMSVLSEVLHRARRQADAARREHRRAEESLRKEREFLSALVENVTDGIVSCDADGVIALFNRVTREFHGLPGEPIPADRWAEHFDLFLADGKTRMSKEQIPLFRALQEGSVRDVEMVIAPKGGTQRRLLCSGQAFYDADGLKAGAVVVLQDITERKEAEIAMSRLSAIVEFSQDAIVGKDLNNTITSWNQGAERVFGYTAEEMVGSSTLRLIPADRRSEEDHILGLIRRGEHVSFETLRQTKDGRLIDVAITVSPIRDGKGNVIGASTVARDITHRKEAEAATARTLQRLHDAQAVGHIGDWECDLATEAIIWSPQVFEIFGRDPSLGPPQDFAEHLALYDSANAKLVKEHIARAIDTGDAQSFELELSRPDGERVHVHAMAVLKKDEIGRVVALYGTIQNITARKRAEAALRTSEQRYRSLFENMVEGYAYCRTHFEGDELRDFTYLEVNAAFERLTGLKDVVGKRISELVPGIREANRELLELYGRVALTGETERVETFVNGLDAWLSITLYSSDRESFVAVFDNITERKRAELEIAASKREIEQLNADLEKRVEQRTEALRAATAEAERANRAKSGFLSRMSHELRTPMNAILGFAQVLETEEGLTAEQRDSVDHILKGGAHLLKLINEVLDITSIEAGRLTISLEPIALPELLEETISLMRPLSAEFGVHLSVAAEGSAPSHVQADRQRLKQVLLNLIGNAIKYNRRGGSVTLCYHAAAGDPAMTRLSISDTGPGLDAGKLRGLFQPFERLGAEQSPIEGTGLGLVLTKRIVEHMHGAIGVESVPDEGSTFWVDLPTAEPPAEPEEPASHRSPVAAPDLPTERRVVLYIEDNPTNVRLISRILARRPEIQMLCADTGARGLRMAREHRPDLILLDLHLPDSDGERVLQRLAAEPRTGAIPVVMLTANAMAEKRAELLDAGARAFMTKPVDVRNFLTVVDQLLN